MTIKFLKIPGEARLTFLGVLGYALFFYGVNMFLSKAGILHNFPDSENLVHWDAGFYKWIADSGYQFNKNASSNSGFSMFFPYVWKLTHFNSWGISILNVVFFASGFTILASIYKWTTEEKILWLSLPPVMFAFVPYSEALFFLFGALLIFGIRNKNYWLIRIALFILCLTRVTTIFLAPALLAMELMINDRKIWHKSLFISLRDYILPIAMGMAAFVSFQYWTTGEWFAYFYQQTNMWQRKFAYPILPFGSMTCDSVSIWLNAIAMFTGFISLILFIIGGVQWLFRNKIVKNGILYMSFVYLILILYVTVFYNPVWCSNATDVNGAFRYTMMNPFFFIFVTHFSRKKDYQWWHYILVAVLSLAFWMLFGSYKHIVYFLFFSGNTVIIVLFMLTGIKKFSWAPMMLVAFNFLIQVILFQNFIGSVFIE